MMPTLKFCPNVANPPEPPAYATDGAAGMDIRTAVEFNIQPRSTFVATTGYDVEVPAGHVLDVRSRSGLAAKQKLFVLNSPGTVDEDYRGPLNVILANLSETEYTFKVGDRIAQLVLLPVVHAKVEVVDELSETVRGAGGFGSTGVG